VNLPKPNYVTTFDNQRINARWGGPRVILCRDQPFEEEEVNLCHSLFFLYFRIFQFDAFVSTPYFFLSQWHRIYQRAKDDHPNNVELKRKASLSDVLFRSGNYIFWSSLLPNTNSFSKVLFF
jgi:hypothetical protein